MLTNILSFSITNSHFHFQILNVHIKIRIYSKLKILCASEIITSYTDTLLSYNVKTWPLLPESYVLVQWFPIDYVNLETPAESGSANRDI